MFENFIDDLSAFVTEVVMSHLNGDTSAFKETVENAVAEELQRLSLVYKDDVLELVQQAVGKLHEKSSIVFEDDLDELLNRRGVVYGDDLQGLIEDMGYGIDADEVTEQVNRAFDYLDFDDVLDDSDLARRVNDLEYSIDDCLATDDLEYEMDKLGYSAWVDTTDQFMRECRSRLAHLEMDSVLRDLDLLVQGL